MASICSKYICFVHLIFRFWFLVSFGDKVTKIRKYYVIFDYILQGKMGKKDRKKITQLKWPKYQKPKDKNMRWTKQETIMNSFPCCSDKTVSRLAVEKTNEWICFVFLRFYSSQQTKIKIVCSFFGENLRHANLLFRFYLTFNAARVEKK